MAKRIISGVLAVVTLFFACMPPVYAFGLLPDISINVDVVEFFEWTNGMLGDTLSNGAGFIWHLIDDDVCPSAPTLGGRHNFVEKRTQVNGKTGLYYICEYCGESAGAVAKKKHTEFVDTLPATGYQSDGSLLWSPSLAYVGFGNYGIGSFVCYCDHYGKTQPSSSSSSEFDNIVYACNCDIDGHFYLYVATENSYYTGKDVCYNFEGLAPVAGTYTLLAGPGAYGSYSNSTGVFTQKSSNFTQGSPIYYGSGALIDSYLIFSHSTNISTLSVDCNLPVYKVVPVEIMLPELNNIYNITTRPTTITGGNYGIVGDDGQLTVVTVNDSIINETNNTYYNPASGNSETITNWTYDYTDRSYNITLESGSTATVTYGDQNITIIEGGVTYIIYYVIDGGHTDPDPDPSESPAPSDGPSNTAPPSGGGTDDHIWTETDRVDPTCTLPGRINYICEDCGQLRVDVLPALGHTWTEKQHVPTTYDDEGNLIQRGYTIYECSVCGEQYKDMLGTGPPGSGSGAVDDGGLTGWLNGLIKFLSDNLSGAVDLILSFFRTIPELFGGFLDFLSAMFPFLPDEVWLLLTFGIAAVVFIGIIKAIRR